MQLLVAIAADLQKRVRGVSLSTFKGGIVSRADQEFSLDKVGDLARDVRAATLVPQPGSFDGPPRDYDEVEVDRWLWHDGCTRRFECGVDLDGEVECGVLNEALLQDDDEGVELRRVESGVSLGRGEGEEGLTPASTKGAMR